MKTIRVAVVASAVAALLLVPMDDTRVQAEETAASCLDGYYKCLNDTYGYDGSHPEEELADVECAAAYTGCVIRKLKFW